tara:strand:+ start:514 stop:915 length:402 start_codon:yes stop_codon:yes gene_type:complete
MSTRSNIVIYNTKTEMSKSIYVHFDGYYSGVGATLKEHYQDVTKVRKLIAGGDVSSLGELVEIPEGVDHSFDNKNKDITVFCGRDRGESGVEAQEEQLEFDRLKRLRENEYLYVYLELEEKWLCTHTETLVEL